MVPGSYGPDISHLTPNVMVLTLQKERRRQGDVGPRNAPDSNRPPNLNSHHDVLLGPSRQSSLRRRSFLGRGIRDLLRPQTFSLVHDFFFRNVKKVELAELPPSQPQGKST